MKIFGEMSYSRGVSRSAGLIMNIYIVIVSTWAECRLAQVSGPLRSVVF